jgi:hypothetical protein
VWRAFAKHSLDLVRRKRPPIHADQIHRTLERVAIDHDLDEVAVAHLSNRTAHERLRSDVSDARAGGQSGEPPIGHERNVLAPREIAQRRRDLRGLLHAGA